ncbi:Uncharacterized protein OBRU01_14763 [Operophtera brumata]|uniref:Cationic amino acid transporter C-terminal domain-containing protein n=1 Tax=Operophtera brumata TaxID=104452 RepID=A0A0L7L566_OPEBR|nr:Uncharacterized protein OBRU01_14763 [Operophtera brumata]
MYFPGDELLGNEGNGRRNVAQGYSWRQAYQDGLSPRKRKNAIVLSNASLLQVLKAAKEERDFTSEGSEQRKETILRAMLFSIFGYPGCRKQLINPVAEDGAARLARVLSALDLTALGVGSTLGVGVYVLAGDVAKNYAGPAVILSFLLAAVASIFAGAASVVKALSEYLDSLLDKAISTSLAAALPLDTPHLARYPDLFAFAVIMIFSGTLVWRVTDSLLDAALSTRLAAALPLDTPHLARYPDLFAFAVIMIFSGTLVWRVTDSLLDAALSTRLAAALPLDTPHLARYPDLFAFAVIMIFSVPKSPTKDFGSGGFAPYGIAGIIKGAAVCFYGFIGFDCVATAGEEARRPQKSIPFAVVASLLVLGWTWAKYAVSVGAICALCSSLLGAVFPLPRIIYAMSSDGLLFKFMGRVSERFQTPMVGTIIAGFFTASTRCGWTDYFSSSWVVSASASRLPWWGLSLLDSSLDEKAPFPFVYDQLGWTWAKYAVSVGAICALCSSLLGAVFPLPRIIYAMSSDGLLFKFMGRVSERFQTPMVGTIIAGFFTGESYHLRDVFMGRVSERFQTPMVGTIIAGFFTDYCSSSWVASASASRLPWWGLSSLDSSLVSRIIYAMSSDGLLFKFMGRVSERFQTPMVGTFFAGFFTASTRCRRTDGLLFKFMGRISERFQTPIVGTIIAGFFTESASRLPWWGLSSLGGFFTGESYHLRDVVGRITVLVHGSRQRALPDSHGVLAMLFELEQLIHMMSIGTLLAYSMVASCVLLLRYEKTKSKTAEPLNLSVRAATRQMLNADQHELPTRLSAGIVSVLVTMYGEFKEQDSRASEPVRARGDATDAERGPARAADASERRDSVCTGHYSKTAEPLNLSVRAATRQMLNADQHELPTRLSAGIVSVLVTMYGVWSFITMYIINTYSEAILALHAGALTALVASSTLVLATLYTISRQPVSEKKLAFSVPLVPWLPGLSILINVYLMLNLDYMTWVRFAVWIAAGISLSTSLSLSLSVQGRWFNDLDNDSLIIYFTYGAWHSSERRRTVDSVQLADLHNDSQTVLLGHNSLTHTLG